jgi:hypothetical protein
MWFLQEEPLSHRRISLVVFSAFVFSALMDHPDFIQSDIRKIGAPRRVDATNAFQNDDGLTR